MYEPNFKFKYKRHCVYTGIHWIHWIYLDNIIYFINNFIIFFYITIKTIFWMIYDNFVIWYKTVKLDRVLFMILYYTINQINIIKQHNII